MLIFSYICFWFSHTSVVRYTCELGTRPCGETLRCYFPVRMHAGSCLFTLELKDSPDGRSCWSPLLPVDTVLSDCCMCWHACFWSKPLTVNDGWNWPVDVFLLSACVFLYRSLQYADRFNPNIFLTPVEDTSVIAPFRPDGTVYFGTAEHGCRVFDKNRQFSALLTNSLGDTGFECKWDTLVLN